ncbi:MAG: hypothetical protein HC925_02460 [Coleofasciculaceae cyanobacterium SM2_3_26]|nr:hypothetical protein [Coleofasciculaceae cyanobacterium SM2_3_26]
MTGFIRRLFGGGKSENSAPAPQPRREAFFLGSDDAKTFGNIDYMRTVKRIRRTFPKVEGGMKRIVEQEKEISNLVEREATVPPTPSFGITSGPKPGEFPKPQSTPAARRSGSSDMDRFRDMARDLKKKR